MLCARGTVLVGDAGKCSRTITSRSPETASNGHNRVKLWKNQISESKYFLRLWIYQSGPSLISRGRGKKMKNITMARSLHMDLPHNVISSRFVYYPITLRLWINILQHIEGISFEQLSLYLYSSKQQHSAIDNHLYSFYGNSITVYNCYYLGKCAVWESHWCRIYILPMCLLRNCE